MGGGGWGGVVGVIGVEYKVPMLYIQGFLKLTNSCSRLPKVISTNTVQTSLKAVCIGNYGKNSYLV